jgi:hypothetical protein
LLYEFAIMWALRERFPLHFIVFKQTACHLSHEVSVEQVFSRAGNLSDPNMDPFQHKSVFVIVYGKVVSVEMAISDPSEPSGGYIYPRCTFITTLLLNPAPWLLHQSLST